ncbi:N-(5'-phosphoribosyl)anthranilate isomerase [Salinarchaeum chitinilyticum]
MDESTAPGQNARPRVKICGHTDGDDLAASVAAGADAVGVITDVDVETPREVTVRHAADLLAGVPPLATGVLVTMPKTVGDAVELIGRTSPDAIQVHGTLEPDAVADLRERVHVDVIAAIGADEEALPAYADAADALLVDTPAADGGGGTGRTHDWDATREATADLDVPVILAGGLDPENVADAIETVRPFGVDVASGVESSGGVKDHDALSAFVRNAREAVPDATAAATEGSR